MIRCIFFSDQKLTQIKVEKKDLSDCWQMLHLFLPSLASAWRTKEPQGFLKALVSIFSHDSFVWSFAPFFDHPSVYPSGHSSVRLPVCFQPICHPMVQYDFCPIILKNVHLLRRFRTKLHRSDRIPTYAVIVPVERYLLHENSKSL